jgi:hypothetical protein
MNIRSNLLFSIVSLGLLWITLPGGARADAIVEVAGTQYNITTVSGTFLANSSALQGTPWWGDKTLARDLAATGMSFGGGNAPCFPEGGCFLADSSGPLFAYDQSDGLVTVAAWNIITQDFLSGTDNVFGALVPDDLEWTWAIGSVVRTPESGTLSMTFEGLAALGLLVGVKRYQRNRPRKT